MKNYTILKLRSKKIFFDSSCFIYTFENNPKYSVLSSSIFDTLEENKIGPIISIITISEVLTKPYEIKDEALIQTYQNIFRHLPGIIIAKSDMKVAEKAAQIRARYKFQLIDSFQLAFAESENADIFLCNDKQLKKYKEMEVLTLDDFNLK